MPSATDRFARRIRQLRPSTIREILKVTAQPEIISFAGGLPAPELFPLEELRAAAEAAMAEAGAQALQYGPSEGHRGLREWIAGEMQRRGFHAAADDVLITNGSQQVLDLVGKLFLDPGDVVLTENPTYLAAVQAFQTMEAQFVPVPTDGEGIIPEAIPDLLRQHRPKFLYTIPNFQNPTGVTLSASRRAALARIAAEQDLYIVEDDPYGQLRYRGTELPPIRQFDTAGRVLYASTFSKIIAPGLRVGWVVAPGEIFSRLLILKQASDLHTSSLDQRIVYRYLADADWLSHIGRIRVAYGERFEVMDATLGEAMPKDFTWTRPDGGMFLWITGPSDLDALALLGRAVAEQVAFVPGRDFFPGTAGANYMRLNFSSSPPHRIQEGVRRLAALCREAENPPR